MLIVTFAYAHNNQSDALRFRDVVHEILRGNKRYVSGDIKLVSQPTPVLKSGPVLENEEDGNMVLRVGNNYFYHCVSVQFIYRNKEYDDPSKPFISMSYMSNGYKNMVSTDSCFHDFTLSKADHAVMTKIAVAYDKFECTELDENITSGPQAGQIFSPEHTMMDWMRVLESRIPESDPLYRPFQEFKQGMLQQIRKKYFAETGKKAFFNKPSDNKDYSWLKNLPNPNDSDGDVPNIKGLKDLLDDIVKYTLSWAKTDIEDINDRMIKVGTYASTCKSVIEGKSSLEIALRCTCPRCKEDIVVNPIYEEKKQIKKDDRLQAFTLPCDTCNCRKESIHRRALMNDLQVKLDAASDDLFKLGVNKERLTLGEIKTAESKIRNEVYACRSAIHQIIQQTAIESWSKDKEEDTVLTQIDELKAKLRTLPDPRYLPNAIYTRKLIDELDDLLNGSNVIKAKDNTYILNADTLYNAVAKLSAIRSAVSKPGIWVDSQTSAWIHLNKDFETLKVLKRYLETEADKDTDDDPLCIIPSDTINHMIELIDDALNLYAVDPE